MSNEEGLDDFDSDDGDAAEIDGVVDVQCPYCGETVTIAVDQFGGGHQEYVEDCQVCCRPWQVVVQTGPDGTVSVTLEPS